MPPSIQAPVAASAPAELRTERTVLAVVVAGALIRLALAAAVPLTVDEAYYVDWARHLQPGYLDHPPLVAWLVALPLRLVGPSTLAVRLPAVLLQAGATLLAASLARALAGSRAALAAALLLQAAPVFSLGATLITPDAPLALGWAGALWSVERAFRKGPRWFLVAGLFLGVGALSKLTAGLLGVAILAALVATRDGRRALAGPWPWAGAVLALAVASPMLVWNAAHGWPSVAFQAAHGARGGGFSLLRLLGAIGAQAGYVSPVILVLAALAAARALRAREGIPARREALDGVAEPGTRRPSSAGVAGGYVEQRREESARRRQPACAAAGPGISSRALTPRDPATAALAFSALPVIAFFTVAAAFTPGALPHWPAPGWLSATVLLAVAGTRLLRPALATGFGIVAAALVLVLAPLPLPGGPLDELRGWREGAVAARAAAGGARLAVTHWIALGQLGWYDHASPAYLGDRLSGPSFYDPDPLAAGAPLLVVTVDGLGPGPAALAARLGPLRPAGEAAATDRGRVIRRYRFWWWEPPVR